MSRRKNSVTSLPAALDKKLIAYIAAASAAGAVVVGTSQSAEAEIVFTRTYKVIDWQAKMGLDLNNDGISDFNFGVLGTFHGQVFLIHPHGSNRVIKSPVAYPGWYGASAMPAGATVGSGAKFDGQTLGMEAESFFSTYETFGPWLNAQNKFLGLEITINGQHHYGWARISFPSFGKGILTGYAYETVPDKPIIAGATSDDAEVGAALKPTDLSPSKASSSLGLLAGGAVGLELWRREEALPPSKS